MDKFWERYITSRPAPGASKGAFDAFAAAHKEPRTMAQEPRNMADGGRIGFAENAGLVNANVIRQKEAIKNLNDKYRNQSNIKSFKDNLVIPDNLKELNTN